MHLLHDHLNRALKATNCTPARLVPMEKSKSSPVAPAVTIFPAFINITSLIIVPAGCDITGTG